MQKFCIDLGIDNESGAIKIRTHVTAITKCFHTEKMHKSNKYQVNWEREWEEKKNTECHMEANFYKNVHKSRISQTNYCVRGVHR